MTSWILVRHGATDWIRDGRYQGQADPPLNAEGLAQAEALASALASHPIQAVLSSDLQRARVTAERIARRHAVAVLLDERLREINQGAWEGMLIGDILAAYPVEWQALIEDPLHARAPGGGESVTQITARAMACLGDLAIRYPLGPVVIVSHGLTLACVLCEIRGFPLEDARRQIPPNAVPVELTWP